jgi:hypothetical protein
MTQSVMEVRQQANKRPRAAPWAARGKRLVGRARAMRQDADFAPIDWRF